ncbi:dynein heavy chain family protein [Besnoitia besnoiti]|uniref:Dynein-1, subspecies f n=1 Tax=Besnoitia besnoiti TaxID=94643 RepID=A0A2A9MDF6_BESBE|nr:dynein heavy chain family protein [Besnoitia besnoiti]PFH33986.1 dynein heavy chain family protein [Besnoitia besnoiti]
MGPPSTLTGSSATSLFSLPQAINQEMNRCIAVGTADEYFIYDLRSLVEDIYLPLLKDPTDEAENTPPQTRSIFRSANLENGDAVENTEKRARATTDSRRSSIGSFVKSEPTEDADAIDDATSESDEAAEDGNPTSTQESTKAPLQAATSAELVCPGSCPASALPSSELKDLSFDPSAAGQRAIDLPAECRQELAATAEQLVARIRFTINEVCEAVPLRVPCEDLEALADSTEAHLVTGVEESVQDWTQAIRAVLEAEGQRRRADKFPAAELEFWRDRNSAVSTLYEQLTVQRIQRVLRWLKQASPGSKHLKEFYGCFEDLQKVYVEAKDTVRFLSTLERHFKSLASGSLKVVAETISPLLSAIRMVWTTSRHYNTDEKMQPLMIRVAEQIADRVQEAVQPSRILHGDVSAAATTVDEAQICLDKWQQLYMDVRKKIEDSECDRRWEFDRRKLFRRTEYMSKVCTYLREAVEVISQFQRFLGPELKTVTRYHKGIDRLTRDVEELARCFDVLGDRGFDESSAATWEHLLSHFRQKTTVVEAKSLQFLDTRFRNLRSAVGAFMMLKNFSTIESRPIINEKLREKFADILKQFGNEVESVREQFESAKENPPLAKGYPKVAGSILWARAFLQRLKESVLEFKCMPSFFQGDDAEVVFTNYLNLARQLVAYQEAVFKKWQVRTSGSMACCLKMNILRKNAEGKYEVNFAPEMWAVMQEARFLDQIGGNDIPHTILNVALQKEKYMETCGLLEQMLQHLASACEGMPPVQTRLLNRHLEKLDKWLQPGLHSLNWTSLGAEEFISSCTKAIMAFRTLRDQVEKNAEIIGEIVQAIQDAELVRSLEGRPEEPFNIQEFYEYFERHRAALVEELQSKYAFITSYIIKIEEIVEGTMTGASEAMAEYYNYWERRVFNAISTMLIRGTSALRALFSLNPGNRLPPLIAVSADFNQAEVVIHGSTQAIFKIISRLMQNILYSATRFSRWMNGTCKRVPPQPGQEEDSQVPLFTFYSEISRVPALIDLTVATHQAIQKVFQNVSKYIRSWKKYDTQWCLWDLKRKADLEKLVDKRPSIVYFDVYIGAYKKLAADLSTLPTTKVIGFLQIDASVVVNGIRAQALDWVNEYGRVLLQITLRELHELTQLVDTSLKNLEHNPDSMEAFKFLLHEINTVKSVSMDAEIRIADAQAMCKTLQTYGCFIEDRDVRRQTELPAAWQRVKSLSLLKEKQLEKKKEVFAQEKRREVLAFASECRGFLDRFTQQGPGAAAVELEAGVDLLAAFTAELAKFQQKRDSLTKAEVLFALPITAFPELDQIRSSVHLLQAVYGLYVEHRSAVAEWSDIPWATVDIQELQRGTDEFAKKLRRLPKDFPAIADMPAYQKLTQAIGSFMNAVPLIERLKTDAMRPQHWRQLMDLTGWEFETDNRKFRLQDVFDLGLSRFPDQVQNILQTAQEEMKLETDIAKIESCWRAQTIDMCRYKADEQSYVLRANEELRTMLEDHILQLQSMTGSRFAAVVMERIKKWEKTLNTIREVFEAWLQVQRKWIYLDGIFTESVDIRLQLPDEAKKFDIVHRQFLAILAQTYQNPSILSACGAENRLQDLKALSAELDRSQRSLSDYLDTKRVAFPRFCFISDDELLSVLGSSSPAAVQPLMLKLFDNCKQLILEAGAQVLGMVSEEGESFQFHATVLAEGPAEEWMKNVDEAMKSTLQRITKSGVYYYAYKPRTQWVLKQLGMVACVGSQIWRTWRVEDAFHEVARGSKQALKEAAATQAQQLTDLIELVRKPLDQRARRKVNTLIILDVHARDMVERFVRDAVLNAREFEWESQLRFYWEKDADDIAVRQCAGEFGYSYEYQGLNGRLVITPLTDRCVMTLTTALSFCLGGAPAGPAGTGKTETVKDLAKSLAIRCVVQNCGDGLDYKAMGTIFSGLVQTGFWGCFDEFNRINPEVLSVVTEQIRAIEMGLQQGKASIELLGKSLKLVSTVGIFVTMNPGYAGRSELPDNLKALFRPATMIVPDSVMICENMLISEGFVHARVLARKMTVLYTLAKAQLSKQHFYDFALRALKAALVTAGALRSACPELPEELILMRALRDMNIPKLVKQDVPLFFGLLGDLFPGVECPLGGNSQLKQAIEEELAAKGFRSKYAELFELQVDKVLQLYDTMNTRHSTMLVGPTGGGKTVIINTLAAAQKAAFDRVVKLHVVNPKAQSTNELYGVLDPVSRDWTDGLLSKIFREINQPLPPGKDERRFVVFDGDVDAVWVENMNSVMDDNRLLTLTNGERIRLEKHCALLFEVDDLQYASPATVSRCGMVYVDPRNLGPAPYFDKWLRARHPEAAAETLEEFYDKYVPPACEFLFKQKRNEDELGPQPALAVARTDLNLVQQLCHLLDILLPASAAQAPAPDRLESIFLFALVWSFGAALVAAEWSRFDAFLRKLANKALPRESLFDCTFDVAGGKWLTWESQVRPYTPPAEVDFTSIFVPTMDTERYAALLEGFGSRSLPVLFVGDSGTAKSVQIQNWLATLDRQKFVYAQVNLSSRTTSLELQRTIEDNLDKRTGRIFGPPSGKRLKLFIDDLSMPKVDTYGTQQPLALLKFVMERMALYERGGDLEEKILKDVSFLAAMNPPGAGANRVDPRVISLFSCFHVNFPSRASVHRIYSWILSYRFREFAEGVQKVADSLPAASLELYEGVVSKLTRTPAKFHYVFNLRDLSRIYQGLWQAKPSAVAEGRALVRLWRHECLRVFQDRLIDAQERAYVDEQLLGSILKARFPEELEHAARNPILFGDFRDALNLLQLSDSPATEERTYEDLSDFAVLRKLLEALLENFNAEHSLNLQNVMFEDAISHIVKVHRILRMNRGHALLIGTGGSGKRSLTQLATYIAGYKLFQLTPTRNYGEAELREDLRALLSETVATPHTFLFSDADVVEEGFLESVNNLLTIGTVPALFGDEEKEALLSRVRESAASQGVLEDGLWSFALNRVRNHLHVVLAMSPAGDALRTRCRNFAGLVSCTSISCFHSWPSEALKEVARSLLKDQALPEPVREEIEDYMVDVHLSVTSRYAPEFDKHLDRKVFATPKNYIDFITSYTGTLETKRKDLDMLADRLEGGLSKMANATEAVRVMNQELAEKKAVVDERRQNVENLISDIEEKSVKASRRQEEATAAAQQISEDQVIITREKQSADEALAAAIPALEAAARALENLDKKDITEIKAFATPPKPVMYVCMCVVVLRPLGKENEAEGWNGAKAMLNDVNFLKSLIEYPKDTITDKQVKKITEHFNKEPESFTSDKMAKISKAGNGLLTWVKAMIDYHHIAKGVEPKRKLVEELSLKKDKAEWELEKITLELRQLKEQIAGLQSDQQEQEARLQEIQTEAALMERRLTAACQLIEGLESERLRWTQDLENCGNTREELVGNCLAGSAFLAYAGPFTFEFRQQMVYEHWANEVRRRQIPCAVDFRLERLLTSDAEVAKWTGEGLPGDEMSIQNGLLTTCALRWPLCIDPQMQAVNWITRHEKANGLVIKSFSDEYLKFLELAMQYGKPFLFEGVEHDLDPLIDPVLESAGSKRKAPEKIMLGGKEIDCSPTFVLYLTTKLANPRFTPEVMAKTTVINYSVTMSGLAEQLLGHVVGFELPELERQRQELVKKMSDGKQMMKHLEDVILHELAVSKGSILDNEDLIQTLQTTKTKATEITCSLEEAKQTATQIDKSRQEYYNVAKRGSIMYFAMSGLRNISSMLEYSLASYLTIFHAALREARPDRILENRLKNVTEKITQLSYDYVCLGLFERQKLMYTFHMTTMIMEGEGALDRRELEFFFMGNPSFDELPAKPAHLAWIPDSGWKDLLMLDDLNDAFKGIVESIKTEGEAWKEWYDVEALESVPLPGEMWRSLTPFQKLLVIRVFRVDRVPTAVKKFIAWRLNDHYVQSCSLQYSKIFAQSSEQCPIVLILSPGADPQSDVCKLAEARGFVGNKFRCLALGQGMAPLAQQYIEKGYQRGYWIMLQNCHLLTSWLKSLAKFLETIQKPHKDFRLWLTTQPIEEFPLSILQRSLKVVTEPPDGLRPNMQGSYAKLTEESLHESCHPAYPSLVYVLSFFHAVVQERRKYGKLGWNVPYDFNEADLSISRRLVAMYLDKSLLNEDAVPWSTPRYLIGEAMYGGRVTDDYDRRVLITYLEEYMGEFIFDAFQPFYFCQSGFDYAVPPSGPLASYQDYIKELPLFNTPEVFGLHGNAEIGYFVDAAKKLWEGILKMNFSGSISSAGGAMREDHIDAVARGIEEKISFDELAFEKADGAYTPTEVVLNQEIERFNVLVDNMRASLNDLRRSLRGEIGLSAELEELANALVTGFLPSRWARLAPASLKPLGSWIAHFLRRYEQYKSWIEKGEPWSFWLSGLQVPDALLTALIQATCRKRGWSLDKSTLLTHVTKFTSPDQIPRKLDHGTYLSGLYLEGARWEIEEGRLARQAPKELTMEMPLIQVTPAETHKLNLRYTLKTPVYATQNRRNAMGEGWVFDATLHTKEHPSLWILSGVALVLQTDD